MKIIVHSYPKAFHESVACIISSKFTDIVGYTGMMQTDEILALIKLNHFKTALNNHVPRFNGEIIQYYGDGA